MKKQGFTLAEILIVVMVIGLIAGMTIPSIIKGVIESQWKSSYKKAYNSITNLYAAEKNTGGVGTSANPNGVLLMFKAMVNSLSVKDYAPAPTKAQLEKGGDVMPDVYRARVSFTGESGDEIITYEEESDTSPWIITEDNIAYSITTGEDCLTKEEINSKINHTAAAKASCLMIVADVNGLNNGPNMVDPQTLDDEAITESKGLNTLTGDRFYIYVGINGIAAGSKKGTTTGRIVSDIK